MADAEEALFSLACQDMPVTGDEVRDAMEAWREQILTEAAEEIRRRADQIATATMRGALHQEAAYQCASLIDPSEAV